MTLRIWIHPTDPAYAIVDELDDDGKVTDSYNVPRRGRTLCEIGRIR